MRLSEVVSGSIIPTAIANKPKTTGFIQTEKAKIVYDMGYTVFDATIFDEFLDTLDQPFYDIYKDIDTKGVNRYYGDLLEVRVDYNRMRDIVRINKEHSIIEGFLSHNRREGLITQRLVQSGLNMYEVSVLECKPEEYTGVVPEFVIKNYEGHKDNFDEVCVIYPDTKHIIDIGAVSRSISHIGHDSIASSNPVDDPILAGKLNSCPGKYFLISYREEDIDLVKQMSLSGKAKIMCETTEQQQSNGLPGYF